MQLDLLWKYMQVDMEADRFENEIRQSPNRLKLLKDRDFLKEQQAKMQEIEADVVNKNDRLEAIKEETKRLGDLVAKETKAFKKSPPKDTDEVDKQLGNINKLLDSLVHYEQEVARMQKDAEALDQKQHEVRVSAAKCKASYDKLKEEYDVEYKDSIKKLADLRANTEKEGKSIDKELLEKYKSIKQHSAPPMAMLAGDQCSGCYMAQPSAVLRELKAGDKLVCCDNCGRMLYVGNE